MPIQKKKTISVNDIHFAGDIIRTGRDEVDDPRLDSFVEFNPNGDTLIPINDYKTIYGGLDSLEKVTISKPTFESLQDGDGADFDFTDENIVYRNQNGELVRMFLESTITPTPTIFVYINGVEKAQIVSSGAPFFSIIIMGLVQLSSGRQLLYFSNAVDPINPTVVYTDDNWDTYTDTKITSVPNYGNTFTLTYKGDFVGYSTVKNNVSRFFHSTDGITFTEFTSNAHTSSTDNSDYIAIIKDDNDNFITSKHEAATGTIKFYFYETSEAQTINASNHTYKRLIDAQSLNYNSKMLLGVSNITGDTNYIGVTDSNNFGSFSNLRDASGNIYEFNFNQAGANDYVNVKFYDNNSNPFYLITTRESNCVLIYDITFNTTENYYQAGVIIEFDKDRKYNFNDAFNDNVPTFGANNEVNNIGLLSLGDDISNTNIKLEDAAEYLTFPASKIKTYLKAGE